MYRTTRLRSGMGGIKARVFFFWNQVRNYIKVKILSNVLWGHLSNNMRMLLFNSFLIMLRADNRRNLPVCIWKMEQTMPLI